MEELKEAITKEIHFMFHGELDNLPDSFIEEVAEYVRTDADDLWNTSDIRMGIYNRIYDLIVGR